MSNVPGLARFTDAHLQNPWGLSSSPNSPIWVSDNNGGVATVYKGDGTALVLPNGVQLAPAIPAPGGGWVEHRPGRSSTRPTTSKS